MDNLLLRRRAITPKQNSLSGQLPLSFNARRMPIKSLTRYGKCEQRRLPKEYTELQYIASTGSQWIDTGVKLNQDDDCEVIFSISANQSAQRIFGSRADDASVKNISLIIAGTANKIVADFTNSNYASYRMGPSDAISLNTKYRAVINKNVRGLYTMGGTTIAENTTACPDVFETAENAYVFSAEDNYRCFVGSIYSVKIAGKRNLIPAKNSSNVVGMYDTVSGTFFTNQGTGSFTAGPVATPTPSAPMDIWCNNGRLKVRHESGLPVGYTLLNYIESSGTQYIDTGITDIVGKEFILDAQLTTPLPGASTFPTQLGARDDTSGDNQYKMVFGTGSADAKFYCQVGIRGDGFVIAAAVDADRHTFRLVTTANNSVYYIDESSYEQNYRTVNSKNYSLYLCARNNRGTASNFCNQKVYGLTVKEGNTILLNLVPVERDSDNAAGMYDLVGRTFFENEGSGSFIAGTTASDPLIAYADGTPEVLTKGNLPLGYTLLDYVQTSGQAYIDTGIKTSLDTEIGAELAFDSASTQILWANHENNTAAITCFITSNGSERFGNKAAPNSNLLQYITAGTFHNIKENKDGIYIDGTKRIQFDATDDFESPNSMYLLWCRNTSQTAFSGKVKGAYIKKGGVLVRNYIPAKRDADNVVGLFDTVTNTFFANQGSGSFTAGSEMSTPCTVADLLAVADYEDEHDLISGLVIHKCGVCVYDGTQTIGDVYLSTTGGKDVGAIIVYQLDTETTESVTPQALNSSAGGNTVSSQANIQQVSADIKYYK